MLPSFKLDSGHRGPSAVTGKSTALPLWPGQDLEEEVGRTTSIENLSGPFELPYRSPAKNLLRLIEQLWSRMACRLALSTGTVVTTCFGDGSQAKHQILHNAGATAR